MLRNCTARPCCFRPSYVTFLVPSNVTSFLWTFFTKHRTSGNSFPCLAWRWKPDLLCLEWTRHVTLNWVLELSVAPHSVWSLFLAQELNAYISTVLRKAPTPSQALIHKNLFIVCACACVPVWDGGSRGCVRTHGEAGLGESLLTFSEPIRRLVRFSRWPMRRMERLEVGVA